MRLSVAAAVLSFFAALAAASPVPDNSGIDPTKVYIETVKYAGSGCKAGSVEISKSDDATVVSLLFDSYSATVGPDTDFSKSHKNCNLNIKIHYPSGFQYTLYQTDYTGFANLEKDVKASQQSAYWFAGFKENTATLKTQWVGPYKKNYSFRDSLIASAYCWSPCGASTTLNINTELDLDNSKNPKGKGFISTEVIDHKVKTLYGILWRRC